MTSTKQRANLSNVHTFVANREDFDCNGSLVGRTHHNYLAWGHRLPLDLVDTFDRARIHTDFYAVYSYATPIAWFANGEWTVPPVKYSPTTSRHQSAIRKGIAA